MGELARDCAEVGKPAGTQNAALANNCLSYLSGWSAGNSTTAILTLGRLQLCFPEGVTTGQAAAIIAKDFEAKPEKWHEPSDMYIMIAFAKAGFNCPESAPAKKSK